MARRTGNKENKGVKLSKAVRGCVDKAYNIDIVGKVTKIFHETDKMVSFGLEVYNITEKGNVGRAWVNCVTFDINNEFDENNYVEIHGHFVSNNYKGNWSNQIVVDSLDVIE